MVHIVHVGLAGIVVDACCGVGTLQFFTLCHHGDNGADGSGGDGVDGQVGCLEDLREVLRHTLGDAVMLAQTNGCQVAQAVFGGLQHRVELGQYLVACRGQLADLLRLLQQLYGHGVVVLFEHIAGTVSAIMRQVIWLVAFRGRSECCARQTVIVSHIACCKELVGSNLFKCRLT